MCCDTWLKLTIWWYIYWLPKKPESSTHISETIQFDSWEDVGKTSSYFHLFHNSLFLGGDLQWTVVLHLTNTCKTPFTWGYFVLCWNWSVVLEKILRSKPTRHIYALRHFIHPGSMDLQLYSFFIYLLISIVNMNEKLFCNETLKLKERHKNS